MPSVAVPRLDHEVPFHLAIVLTATPPADVNNPPAYRFPLASTESELTPPFIPVPRLDHEVPFHFAILLTVTPPAVVKPPAA